MRNAEWGIRIGVLLLLAICLLQLNLFLGQIALHGQALAAQIAVHDARLYGIESKLDGTLVQLHGAAVEQRRYYKASGKELAITFYHAGELVKEARQVMANANMALVNADMRMGELAKGGIAVEEKAVELLEATRQQAETNGYEATLALAAARGNFEQMEKLWPVVNQSARNTEKFTGESAAIAEELNQSLKKKTSLALRILLALIPRPTLSAR